jgi:hypothetical protein
VYKILILDVLKIIDVIVCPVFETALFSQRDKLIVGREVKLRRLEAYDYNLLIGGPELV